MDLWYSSRTLVYIPQYCCVHSCIITSPSLDEASSRVCEPPFSEHSIDGNTVLDREGIVPYPVSVFSVISQIMSQRRAKKLNLSDSDYAFFFFYDVLTCSFTHSAAQLACVCKLVLNFSTLQVLRCVCMAGKRVTVDAVPVV